MEHLGKKFKLIDQELKMRMNEDLKKIDLTFSQMQVARYLDMYSDEKITQKQLSEALNVKHSTMAGLLSRMEMKGLVEITVDETNRKYRNIKQTLKAQEIKKQIGVYHDKTENVLLKGFSKTETENLRNYLERVYINLQESNDTTNLKGDIKHNDKNISKTNKGI